MRYNLSSGSLFSFILFLRVFCFAKLKKTHWIFASPSVGQVFGRKLY